ncbi:hypothetical protein OSJ77_03185 [Phyllobacterium sp. 0TCS1.6C]|uniref:hypothetical protein n=1 Tax=unclassified Phyllobacterium TaxID=2638441 RepID=UPI002264B402|nr:MULTISPECIES: hypothetical protein [unclassified Phyllobacterium]MCX8279183.1 hypothetical protein [Phyllobacterium sp. 0TCS1.6C]MCX8293967.1 hypothetical protein [Phyllobacterium sp. 0TCS1.6A]
MGGATAPDVQDFDQYIGDNQCVQHAMDTAGQYAAMVHFLGVLAGVYGSQAQEEAAEKVKAAVSDLIETASSSLSKANDMANDAALGWGGALMDGYFAVGEWFLRHGSINGDEMADDVAKTRQTLGPQQRAAARERFKRDWNALWADIKSWAAETYAKIKEMCLNGQWKQALCKFGIDLAFAILENVVIAAVAAVTAGAAAVAAKVGFVAIKRGQKFAVSLIRKDRGGRSHALGEVSPSEFNDAEKRILGSDNQGTTVRDPDAGPAELDDAGNAKQQRGKDRNTTGRDGEKYYTDKYGGRSLQNGSGHGIDHLDDKGVGNGITFNEIKTSTVGDYRLRGDELLGGDEFVRSRLGQMSGGDRAYSSMSDSDTRYARQLLRRLEAGESVTYQKVKLKKNPDGSITEEGVESWERNEDAYRRWREQEDKKKQRRAARKTARPDTAANPSTGPPSE